MEDPKTNSDNHSNQLNPNNDAYWQARGHDSRPGDWDDDDTRNSYDDDDDDLWGTEDVSYAPDSSDY